MNFVTHNSDIFACCKHESIWIILQKEKNPAWFSYCWVWILVSLCMYRMRGIVKTKISKKTWKCCRWRYSILKWRQIYPGSWVRGLHTTDTAISAGRIYGALFDLMCILKGNSRRINFKLTWSSPSKRLGVTDVHDKAKQRRTSKGGQNKAETTTCFHMSFLPLLCFLWALTVVIHRRA